MSRLPRRLALLTVLAATLLGGGTVGAAGVPDPLERPAQALRVASKGMLLALSSTGGDKPRLVAAGERGIIVLSDNGGISWRQARVPMSVTLTALAFPTPDLGWAVGHGGVILHSADGGETWLKQLDGVAAARIADDAAKAGGDATLQARTAQLVTDGPDKPFMAVHFTDPGHGFAVGAYGLIFGTEDGGASWHSWLDRIDNAKGLHLNAIAADGDVLYLAGEQGLLLRSDDRGRHFGRLAAPYQGSFFAAAAAQGTVIVAGLKGNAFLSTDRGTTFSRIEGTAPASIIQGRRLDDGRLLFINQAGQLLLSTDGGHGLAPVALPPGPPALAAIPLANGTWILAGSRGLARVTSH